MFVHAYRIRGILIPCICVLCTICPSCIVVPAKPFNQVIIEEDTLASIEVGRDTRASLAQLIGTPLLRSPDNSRWIYKARVYNPSSSQLCAPAYQSFDCQQLGVTYHEFVDLRFAPDGTLEDVATVVADDDEYDCTDSGICLSLWPRALALYAQPGSHTTSDERTQHLCTIYAYFDADSSPYFSLPLGDSYALQLGSDQAVLWIQSTDFVSVALEPGTRRFWAISQNVLMDLLELAGEEHYWSIEKMAAAPWVSKDVACGPGEERYFELGYRRDGRQEILEVEDLRGKQEIAERRELVSMYASEYPYVQPATPDMRP